MVRLGKETPMKPSVTLIVLGAARSLTLGGPAGPVIEPNMQPARAAG